MYLCTKDKLYRLSWHHVPGEQKSCTVEQ